MKWFVVIGSVVLAAAVWGCGTETKVIEKTVTETVTATPSPTIEPVEAPEPAVFFTDAEVAAIGDFTRWHKELRHILNTEEKAVNAGARGDMQDLLYYADHYATDFAGLRREYRRSNGGEWYGGKLSALERKYEDAAEHVRKYGKYIIGVAAGEDPDSAAVARESVRAMQGLNAMRRELERLSALTDSSL